MMAEEGLRKRCPRCGRALLLARFGRNRAQPDDYQTYCRECQRGANNACYAAHAEERKAYRAAHRGEAKAYYIAHRARRKAQAKAWRAAHSKEARVAAEAWRKAHPERWREIRRANHAIRRARLRGAAIGDAKDLHAAYNFIHAALRLRCYWCGKVVPVEDRHVDHIVPLAQGGAHAAWNLCCACAGCNLRKRAALPAEFVGQGELAFA